MSEPLLSTKEAASRLRRSEQWVRNAARDGELDCLVEPLRGGRTRYRFTSDCIERYLTSHGPSTGRGSELAGQARELDAVDSADGTETMPLYRTATIESNGQEPPATTRMATPVRSDAEQADTSLWIDHYREEITRYRLRVAELERTIDDMFVTSGEKDDEIARLCDVIRRLLPDPA